MSRDCDQRHPGLEQRRELLVEDQKLLPGDSTAARPQRGEPGEHTPRLKRKDIKALFLKVPAQPGLTVGDVDAFDYLAVGSAEPAAKFHVPSLDLQSYCFGSTNAWNTRTPSSRGSKLFIWGTPAGTKVLSTDTTTSVVSPEPSCAVVSGIRRSSRCQAANVKLSTTALPVRISTFCGSVNACTG